MPKINSRQKGASGERELANRLTALGLSASRGQQFQGTPDSPDVRLKGTLGGKIFVECKRVQKLDLHQAMAKAIKDAGPTLIPVIIHRKNKTDWLMTCRIEDGVMFLKSVEFGLGFMESAAYDANTKGGL